MICDESMFSEKGLFVWTDWMQQTKQRKLMKERNGMPKSIRCCIINRIFINLISVSLKSWDRFTKNLKVRGPFFETFCIEKDSYMDSI